MHLLRIRSRKLNEIGLLESNGKKIKMKSPIVRLENP